MPKIVFENFTSCLVFIFLVARVMIFNKNLKFVLLNMFLVFEFRQAAG